LRLGASERIQLPEGRTFSDISIAHANKDLATIT